MSGAHNKHRKVLAPCFLLSLLFLLSVAMVTGDSGTATKEEEAESNGGHQSLIELLSAGATNERARRSSGIQRKDKISILKTHRQFRPSVEPPAIRMEKIKWNKQLAATAQAYANKCIFGHNTERGNNMGENIAWGSGAKDVEGYIQRWYNEKQYYDYDSNTCQSGKMCGHYTQVVWANTKKVGCGLAYCEETANIDFDPSSGYLFVCNYSPAGNVRGQWPYETAA